MLIKYFLGHKKALTLCGGCLVIALTLYPMFYRTWAFGSDAWGLTVIALLDPEEVPWSPRISIVWLSGLQWPTGFSPISTGPMNAAVKR